jgi:hypothetical protein
VFVNRLLTDHQQELRQSDRSKKVKESTRVQPHSAQAITLETSALSGVPPIALKDASANNA